MDGSSQAKAEPRGKSNKLSLCMDLIVRIFFRLLFYLHATHHQPCGIADHDKIRIYLMHFSLDLLSLSSNSINGKNMRSDLMHLVTKSFKIEFWCNYIPKKTLMFYLIVVWVCK